MTPYDPTQNSMGHLPIFEPRIEARPAKPLNPPSEDHIDRIRQKATARAQIKASKLTDDPLKRLQLEREFYRKTQPAIDFLVKEEQAAAENAIRQHQQLGNLQGAAAQMNRARYQATINQQAIPDRFLGFETADPAYRNTPLFRP